MNTFKLSIISIFHLNFIIPSNIRSCNSIENIANPIKFAQRDITFDVFQIHESEIAKLLQLPIHMYFNEINFNDLRWWKWELLKLLFWFYILVRKYSWNIGNIDPSIVVPVVLRIKIRMLNQFQHSTLFNIVLWCRYQFFGSSLSISQAEYFFFVQSLVKIRMNLFSKSSIVGL